MSFNIEQVRQAIIKKTGENLPENRFRILKNYGNGMFDVYVIWEDAEREFMTVVVDKQTKGGEGK